MLSWVVFKWKQEASDRTENFIRYLALEMGVFSQLILKDLTTLWSSKKNCHRYRGLLYRGDYLPEEPASHQDPLLIY